MLSNPEMEDVILMSTFFPSSWPLTLMYSLEPVWLSLTLSSHAKLLLDMSKSTWMLYQVDLTSISSPERLASASTFKLSLLNETSICPLGLNLSSALILLIASMGLSTFTLVT